MIYFLMYGTARPNPAVSRRNVLSDRFEYYRKRAVQSRRRGDSGSARFWAKECRKVLAECAL